MTGQLALQLQPHAKHPPGGHPISSMEHISPEHQISHEQVPPVETDVPTVADCVIVEPQPLLHPSYPTSPNVQPMPQFPHLHPHVASQPNVQKNNIWSYENDNGEWTPITDPSINQLLSNSFAELNRDPSHSNFNVLYCSGSQQYLANLKQLMQKNIKTGQRRALLPPEYTHTVVRYRGATPSFREALKSEVVACIAQAVVTRENVTNCLQQYANDYDKALGPVQDFQNKIQHTGLLIGAVWLYTVDGWVYKEVNSVLRTEDEYRIRKLAPYIAALQSACETLSSNFTSLSATPTTLFRRMDLNSAELKKYKKGQSFVWNSFTSTSINIPPANGPFGSTLFEIEFTPRALKATLFVEPWTDVEGEQEVLIPLGCFFQVLSNHGNVVKLQLLGAGSVFCHPLCESAV
eukprot:TRINITY_DN66747_c1_g4_i1.p1 TRINITY_DN66747_c1_g4~~TRINITY_DN66747_c1_g4_i1.p1  ORF type:complete len:434 (-),score=42.75 TRINITY_DN66747_c1_g4_i1:4-1221(-)